MFRWRSKQGTRGLIWLRSMSSSTSWGYPGKLWLRNRVLHFVLSLGWFAALPHLALTTSSGNSSDCRLTQQLNSRRSHQAPTESLYVVTQLWTVCGGGWVCSADLALYDLIDCSTGDASIYGLVQATVLEWIAIPFSRGSSCPRDRTHTSCTSPLHLYVPRAASV